MSPPYRTAMLMPILTTTMLFLCWFYDECDGTQSSQLDSKLCPATTVNTYLDALRVCRGDEFQEVSACQDERLSMRCPRSHYIVVYTALWQTSVDTNGRLSCRPTSEGCTGQQAVDCILQVISLRCQGRRYCSLVGSEQDIQGPCLPEQPGRRLNVVYVCLTKLAQRDMTAGWRRVDPCLSTTSPSYELTPSVAVPANISDMFDDDSQWFDEYPPIVTSSYAYSASPTSTSDVRHIPVVVHTLDIGSKMAVTMTTLRPYTQMLHTSTKVHQTVPAVIVVEQEPISYNRDEQDALDHSVVSDWVATGQFLIANSNKGVTFLLLGVAIGVLGVLAVVIARLCKLYWRPVKKSRLSSSSSTQSSSQRCQGDQYSPVPVDADIDGTTCVMVPVTSPPSGKQAKRSCSQLPVHWIRSESDRDPTVSSHGILRNNIMMGPRDVHRRLSAAVSPTDSSLIDHHELTDIQEEILSSVESPSPLSSSACVPAAASFTASTAPSVHFADVFTRPRSSMSYDHPSSTSTTMLQSFSAGDVSPTSMSGEHAIGQLPQLDARAVGSPTSSGGQRPGSETSSITTLLGRYWWPTQTRDNITTAEFPGDGSLRTPSATAQGSPTSRPISSSSSDNRTNQFSPQVRVEIDGVVSYCRPASSMSSGMPSEENQYSAYVSDSLRDKRFATAPRRVNKNVSAAAAERSIYYPNGTYQPFQTYAAVGGKLVSTSPSNSFETSDANGHVGTMLPASTAARQWHMTPDGYRVPPTATIHRSLGVPSRSFLHRTAEPNSLLVTSSGSKQIPTDFEKNIRPELRSEETVGSLSVDDPDCLFMIDCTRNGGEIVTQNTKSTLQSYCI